MKAKLKVYCEIDLTVDEFVGTMTVEVIGSEARRVANDKIDAWLEEAERLPAFNGLAIQREYPELVAILP